VVNVQPWYPTGVNVDGHREVLSLKVTSAETAPGG
jgi:transposase-like protein